MGVLIQIMLSKLIDVRSKCSRSREFSFQFGRSGGDNQEIKNGSIKHPSLFYFMTGISYHLYTVDYLTQYLCLSGLNHLISLSFLHHVICRFAYLRLFLFISSIAFSLVIFPSKKLKNSLYPTLFSAFKISEIIKIAWLLLQTINHIINS